MATNALMLSIPNPCSENWNNMTPQEKGRFCDACQKCVVDFTAMSDAAVLDYFNKNNGKVCGRFDKRQLDRMLIINDIRYQKRFNIAASLLFLSSLGFANTVKPNAVMPLRVQQFYAKSNLLETSISASHETSSDEMITIKGNVIDSMKEAMVGASVVLKGTTIGTIADIDGEFTITLSRETFKDGILVVSLIGYETQEYELSKFRIREPLIIELKESDMALQGEMIIVGGVSSHRPKLWKRFTNLFRRKGHKKW
jgi:CarboxypepD_reg-like domain